MRGLKKIFSIIGIFFSYIVLVSIIKGIVNDNEPKDDKVLVEAKIVSVIPGGKTNRNFDCLIEYKNKKKEMPGTSTISNDSCDVIGKTFPAMYSPNKNILEVLITPKDFEKFNIPFPDSLDWVIPDVTH